MFSSKPPLKTAFFFAFCFLLLYLSIERSYSQANLAPWRVLFVGNSVTDYHEMPTWVAEIAKTLRGAPPLQITKAVIGGATFTTHLSDKTGTGGLAAIRGGQYDVVILQDTIEDPLRHTDFYSSLKKLVEESSNKHSNVMLFETYAFAKNAVAYFPEEKWSGGSPSAMQAKIRAIYTQAAQKLNVRLAPVGDAFELVLSPHFSHSAILSVPNHDAFSVFLGPNL